MTNFPTVCVSGSVQRCLQGKQEWFYEILSKYVLPERVKSDLLALERMEKNKRKNHLNNTTYMFESVIHRLEGRLFVTVKHSSVAV